MSYGRWKVGGKAERLLRYKILLWQHKYFSRSSLSLFSGALQVPLCGVSKSNGRWKLEDLFDVSMSSGRWKVGGKAERLLRYKILLWQHNCFFSQVSFLTFPCPPDDGKSVVTPF